MSGTAVIVSVVLDQLTLLNHFLSLVVVIIIIISSFHWGFCIPSRKANILNEGQEEIRQQFIIL